jgi:hypothetical protein
MKKNNNSNFDNFKFEIHENKEKSYLEVSSQYILQHHQNTYHVKLSIIEPINNVLDRLNIKTNKDQYINKLREVLLDKYLNIVNKYNTKTFQYRINDQLVDNSQIDYKIYFMEGRNHVKFYRRPKKDNVLNEILTISYVLSMIDEFKNGEIIDL